MQQAPPRDGGDERSSRGGKLRADDCSPPHLIDGTPRSTGAYHQRPRRSGLIGPPATQVAFFQPIRRCSIAARPPEGNGAPLIGPLPWVGRSAVRVHGRHLQKVLAVRCCWALLFFKIDGPKAGRTLWPGRRPY
jgi:hypothetical protein